MIKYILELEAANKQLREALPVWHSGDEIPEIMGEYVLIETTTGGYRIGFFAGIHSAGYIRYNDLEGNSRLILPDIIARWAYVKDLKGTGR